MFYNTNSILTLHSIWCFENLTLEDKFNIVKLKMHLTSEGLLISIAVKRFSFKNVSIPIRVLFCIIEKNILSSKKRQDIKGDSMLQ